MGDISALTSAPLPKQSMPAMLAERLRAAIAEGRLRPGQQLFEQDLAAEFDVSRGPLREAVQRLTQEELLVNIRNRGLFVTTLSAGDVDDICRTRAAIERAAGLEIIRSNTHAAAGDSLDAIVDRMAEAIARHDDAEVAEIDIEFHEQLVALAHSPRLSRAHRTLVVETRMCLSLLEGTEYATRDRITDHHTLADAIRRAEGSTFGRLITLHMETAALQIRSAVFPVD